MHTFNLIMLLLLFISEVSGDGRIFQSGSLANASEPLHPGEDVRLEEHDVKSPSPTNRTYVPTDVLLNEGKAGSRVNGSGEFRRKQARAEYYDADHYVNDDYHDLDAESSIIRESAGAPSHNAPHKNERKIYQTQGGYILKADTTSPPFGGLPQSPVHYHPGVNKKTPHVDTLYLPADLTSDEVIISPEEAMKFVGQGALTSFGTSVVMHSDRVQNNPRDILRSPTLNIFQSHPATQPPYQRPSVVMNRHRPSNPHVFNSGIRYPSIQVTNHQSFVVNRGQPFTNSPPENQFTRAPVTERSEFAPTAFYDGGIKFINSGSTKSPFQAPGESFSPIAVTTPVPRYSTTRSGVSVQNLGRPAIAYTGQSDDRVHENYGSRYSPAKQAPHRGPDQPESIDYHNPGEEFKKQTLQFGVRTKPLKTTSQTPSLQLSTDNKFYPIRPQNEGKIPDDEFYEYEEYEDETTDPAVDFHNSVVTDFYTTQETPSPNSVQNDSTTLQPYLLSVEITPDTASSHTVELSPENNRTTPFPINDVQTEKEKVALESGERTRLFTENKYGTRIQMQLPADSDSEEQYTSSKERFYPPTNKPPVTLVRRGNGSFVLHSPIDLEGVPVLGSTVIPQTVKHSVFRLGPSPNKIFPPEDVELEASDSTSHDSVHKKDEQRFKLTTVNLAYILIGSCCGISVLCLVLVAISLRCKKALSKRRLQRKLADCLQSQQWHYQMPSPKASTSQPQNGTPGSVCSSFSCSSYHCGCGTWSLGAKNLDSKPLTESSFRRGPRKLPFGAASSLHCEVLSHRNKRQPLPKSSSEDDSLDAVSTTDCSSCEQQCTCVTPEPTEWRGLTDTRKGMPFNGGVKKKPPPPPPPKPNHSNCPKCEPSDTQCHVNSDGVVFWSSNDERLI